MRTRTPEHRRSYVESSVFNRKVASHAVRDQAGNKGAQAVGVVCPDPLESGLGLVTSEQMPTGPQGHRAPSAQPGPGYQGQTRAQGGQEWRQSGLFQERLEILILNNV